jgi:hypothetical protein
MSTLTYAGQHHLAPDETAEAKPVRKPFWTKLYRAIVASQQRRADREIARFLATRGPLTDEVEREIMRRLSGASPR